MEVMRKNYEEKRFIWNQRELNWAFGANYVQNFKIKTTEKKISLSCCERGND